jgi:hypothetical protein
MYTFHKEDGNCTVCQNNRMTSTDTKKAELIYQTLTAGNWWARI